MAAPGAPAAATAGGALSATPWVVSTYFAEGLPYVIAHKVASEFFTAAGADLIQIGYVSWFGLPWNLKFLWSPLVDVYSTARRWVILMEIALAVAVGALALAADQGALALAAGGFALVAILAATHDIAIDGFYLQALDRTRQTSLSGLRVAAYRGAMLAGGLLVALAGATSWRWSFASVGAALALLAAVHAAILPRPRVAAAAPGGGARRLSLAAFTTYLAQPKIGAILAFIVLYRCGDALMFAMSSPLLRSLDIETTARGFIASAGTGASIAGSMLGGLVVARFGLRRTIFPIALLQSLAIPLYIVLAWLRPATPWAITLVMLEQLAAGIGTAVLTVFLMRRCSEEYKASHFAIGTALMSVPVTFFGSVSGLLADRVGFTAFFAIAFASSIPGVILSRRVPVE